MTLARQYWDLLAADYQKALSISCDAFHVGPLLAGGGELGLLPADLVGVRCLELGCGAAQNSVFLARQGAVCTAVDISVKQLEHGRRLARTHGVDIDLIEGDIMALPATVEGDYDFIHSVYAIPFVEDQRAVIDQAVQRLRPGGRILLSTAHPLFTGEWLALDEDEVGIFIQDYWSPVPDVRTLPDGRVGACCQAVPISELVTWLTDAGLVVEQLLEPRPLAAAELADEAAARRVPYDGAAWRELMAEMSRVPAVVVVLASWRTCG